MSHIHSIQILPPARGEEEKIPHYPDRGCELAPRCLECPLPRCRFDLVEGKQWRRRPKGIPNRRRRGNAKRGEGGV
jgi:hypothetical protein